MIYFQLSRFTYGSKIVFRSVKTMFYFFWAQKAVCQTAWVIALHWLWYINVVPPANSDRFYHSFYWDHISFSYSEVIAPHILAFENVSFHGHLYRPQTKLRKGNVFTPVCKSFWSQGGVFRACMGEDTLPGPTAPGQTPPCKHPTCPVHAGIHTLTAQCMAGIHAPSPAATAADGTHLSGKHSCIKCF